MIILTEDQAVPLQTETTITTTIQQIAIHQEATLQALRVQ